MKKHSELEDYYFLLERPRPGNWTFDLERTDIE